MLLGVVLELLCIDWVGCFGFGVGVGCVCCVDCVNCVYLCSGFGV